MSYQLIFQYNLQCPPPNPSHCEGFCNVPFLSVLRSGLLTFFSSLVIQESLINFAGERLRSRMTSHCEIILGFYLSASHPELNSGVKLSSPSQKWRAFPQTSAERFTFLPAFESNVPFLGAMSHILKRSLIFVFES